MKSLTQLMFFHMLLLFILCFAYTSGHCGINLLNKPRRVLVQQEKESVRLLKEEAWEPIRIHLDYSKIDNNIGRFTKEDVRDLKERIMPKTIQVLQKILKVKRIPQKLKLQEGLCDEIAIPDRYKTEGVDADLVIFVKIDETGMFLDNHIEAAAIHCLQDETSRRPIAGYIEFKPNIQVNNSTAADYMIWLALHEITHILVFNDALYPDWVDHALNPLGYDKVITTSPLNGGKRMNLIKSPKVLQKGIQHFRCSTMKGIPLEYNGGSGTAGAHWSKKYMNTDVMIGDSYGENLISEITLALFEDSGWYLPDYELSNLFLWGRNKGCNFFDIKVKCVETIGNQVKSNFKDEFCTKLNYPICSPSYIFRGNCRGKYYHSLPPYETYFKGKIGGADDLTDKCPIPIETKMGQNYYGGSCRVGVTEDTQAFEKICPECACFMSNLRKPGNILYQNDRRNKLIRSEAGNEERSVMNATEFNNSTKVNNKVQQGNLRNLTDSNYTRAPAKISVLKQNLMQLPPLNPDDLAAQCFEYKCENKDQLVVIINGKKYQCKDNLPIRVAGYWGEVYCPPKDILCHPKFKCKFGCVEKFSNSFEFREFK